MTLAGITNVADWNEARGVTNPLAAKDAAGRSHVIENFMAGKPTYGPDSKQGAVGPDPALLAAVAGFASLQSLNRDPALGADGTGGPHAAGMERWSSGQFAVLSDGTHVHWGGGSGWVWGPAPAIWPRPRVTGAVAGSPGSWVPDGALPVNQNEANFVHNAGTAWAGGQSIFCADGTELYWDGAAWKVGKAPTS